MQGNVILYPTNQSDCLHYTTTLYYDTTTMHYNDEIIAEYPTVDEWRVMERIRTGVSDADNKGEGTELMAVSVFFIVVFLTFMRKCLLLRTYHSIFYQDYHEPLRKNVENCFVQNKIRWYKNFTRYQNA